MTLLSQNERRVWTRQPQVRTGGNSKLAASGLWNGAVLVDQISGQRTALATSGAAQVAIPSGVGIKVSGLAVADRAILAPAYSKVGEIGARDFTAICRFTLDSTNGYNVFGKWNTGGSPTTCEWLLGAGAGFGGSTADFMIVVGATTYVASITGLSWGVGRTYTIVGRRSGTTISVILYDSYTKTISSASVTNAGITSVNTQTGRALKLGEIDLGSAYNAEITVDIAATFARTLSDTEINVAISNPWQLFAPRRTRRYISLGAGGGARTLTTSLAAAIQAAQSATASMSAGVQAARTNTATTDAAVQAAKSAQASLNAAVSNINQAVASLGGAVLNSGATSASANAAVQLARNATASLNLAVQAQGNATASVSAQVQAGSSLSAALDGYVQAGSSISASASAAVLASALAQAGIAAAVQTPATTTAGLSAALRAAQQATAAIDAALQLTRNATAGLSAQVQSGTSASVAIDAAIRATAQAVAGVDAAIVRAGSASLSMGAAVALQRSITAAMAGALLSSRLSAVSANAYVFDPLSLIRVYASWQRSGRQEQLTATSRAGQVTSSRRPPQ